jgi:hypothetical protein
MMAAIEATNKLYEVHISHCNLGEYKGVCKYGADDCPALKEVDEFEYFELVNDGASHASRKFGENYNACVEHFCLQVANLAHSSSCFNAITGISKRDGEVPVVLWKKGLK